MGPITLFDKSFLQSLTVDESVWFDHFFLTNVCPLFYVETLADLDKVVRDRSSEREVAIIADKFPQMHGTPSAHHIDLCISELLGNSVPMTSQIPVAGGRLVKIEGKVGAVFERSPESDAFSRWQRGEFLDIEREYARAWRDGLSALPLGDVAGAIRKLGIDAKMCKSIKDAKDLAESVVSGSADPFMQLQLALLFLGVPEPSHPQILRRWTEAGRVALTDFAPYASYVLKIELFFHIAVAANHISSDRPSNRVDISYLFYLPFCMMFVSNDRLHRRCAPMFLRSDQEFVWGLDLKANLAELNSHYLQLPNDMKQAGVMSFTEDPARVGSCMVAGLWDRLLLKSRKDSSAATPEGSQLSAEQIHGMAEAPALAPDEVDVSRDDADRVLLKRQVTRKKGSWHQVPKDI